MAANTPDDATTSATGVLPVDIDHLTTLSWRGLQREAEAYLSSGAPADAYTVAVACCGRPQHQIRFFGVLVLGGIAATDARALAFLTEHCADDPAWQVHEALGMAIDAYGAAVGYEQALPVLWAWLRSPSWSIRRAVSEGLRPWTASRRAYFALHPEAAIDLLGLLRDDEQRSVQESVGNALRDIGRKQAELVRSTVEQWLAERPESRGRQIIARHALRGRA